MTTPLNTLDYEPLAYDLVRYRDVGLDDQIWQVIAEAISGGDLDTFRRQLDEGDLMLIATFARRRIVKARREANGEFLHQAFRAYALAGSIGEAELNVWIKGALLTAQDIGTNVEELFDIFAEIALEPSVDNLRVVIDALERLEHLAQCHLVATETSYGPGLLNIIVQRDAVPGFSISAMSAPGKVSAFQVAFDNASRVASVAAQLADAFDELEHHDTTEIRHDQLVATSFDVVTGGSFLPARACVSFHVNVLNGPSFSVILADVDAAETGYAASDLAEMADELVEQAAVAVGDLVALLTVVPDFDEFFGEFGGDEEIDETETDEVDDEIDDDPLALYLERVRAILDAANN